MLGIPGLFSNQDPWSHAKSDCYPLQNQIVIIYIGGTLRTVKDSVVISRNFRTVPTNIDHANK